MMPHRGEWRKQKGQRGFPKPAGPLQAGCGRPAGPLALRPAGRLPLRLGGDLLALDARLARRTTDDVAQLVQFDEIVGLAAQFVGDHRRLAADGRDHRDAHALSLQAFHQRAEIAVAGEQHDVVDPGRKLHGVDRQLDVHVALDLAAALAVRVFLGGLRHHGEAVVVQPVDQRADRGIVIVLEQSRVVEGTQQFPAPHEFLPQQLVVDVEPKRLRRRVKIGSVDEQREPFVLVKHYSCPLEIFAPSICLLRAQYVL